MRFLAQYDADCELFEKIIFGDLCEETYYDQVTQPTFLIRFSAFALLVTGFTRKAMICEDRLRTNVKGRRNLTA